MLRGQTSRPEPGKKRLSLSKRGNSMAWRRGLTCTHFRPPFEVLRGQTSRPEPTKKRLGMSLSAQHYQDQQRARKGRQKPPFETGKQHGVAGSRAPALEDMRKDFYSQRSAMLGRFSGDVSFRPSQHFKRRPKMGAREPATPCCFPVSKGGF